MRSNRLGRIHGVTNERLDHRLTLSALAGFGLIAVSMIGWLA